MSIKGDSMRVTKRGNTYQYDFYYKGKRYRKGGYLSKKLAMTAMSLKHTELVEGFDVGQKISFVQYYKHWVEVTKQNQINEKSYQRYITAINVFEDCFGQALIEDINILSYRRFLKKYGEGYYCNNGTLRPRTTNTVSKLNNCLRQAFESAIDQGLIKVNPTKNAKPLGFKASQVVDEKFMTLEELKLLLKHVEGKKHLSYLCIFILIITGSRFRPVRELRYEHIDLENSTIFLDDRKNKYSQRKIKVPLDDLKYILEILEVHPKNQNGYIFHNKVNFITYKAVNDVLKNFCIQNSLQHYTLKSLRHTHCSYLLAQGMTIQYISKRLGHADIHTTLTIYSHLLKEYEDAEDETLIHHLQGLSDS